MAANSQSTVGRRQRMYCVIAYVALVTLLTHVPLVGASIQRLSSLYDKPMHVALYFGMAMLICWWLGAVRGRSLYAVGMTGLVACLDEVLQWFVPSRHPDWIDWLAGFCGALLAVVVYELGIRLAVFLRAQGARSSDVDS